MQKYFLIMLIILGGCYSVPEENTSSSRYQRNYRPAQPQQYQPQYQPQYRVPNSRMYNNPYAIQQNGYGYDSDQYYTPPTYYYNVEPQQQRFDTRY